MDKSLLDIEQRLKDLNQPSRSEANQVRLNQLMDELAADAVLLSSPELENSSNRAKYIGKAHTSTSIHSPWIIVFGTIACLLLFSVSSYLYMTGLNKPPGSLELVSEKKEFLKHVRSETKIQMLGIDEGLSDDGSVPYRVERYSVVDSDIYKDSKSGLEITLQQSRKEERREPITYF